MSEWQPISTVPKGKLVILYWPPTDPPRDNRSNALAPMIRVDYPGMTPNRLPTLWLPLPELPK